MIKPIVNMSNLRLNNTLHGRSVYRKQDVPGHNCILGYNKPGTGDGIDLFAPAGEPIYACHSGRIGRVFDRSGKLSGCYIIGQNITTVYAHLHLKDMVISGKQISEGDCIGWVGKVLKDPHIHFECKWNGKAVTGETPAGMLKHLLEVLTGGM